MIKSELVQRISTQNPHLYQRDVENIVNAILGEIIAAMARGDRVELRGFGAFSVKNRPARTGRNPRTGAHVVGRPEIACRSSRPARKCASGSTAANAGRLSQPSRDRWHACCARSSRLVILVPLAVVIVAFAVANRADRHGLARSVRARAAGCRR